MIYTDRLVISLLSDEAMEEIIRLETDEDLKTAYREMLNGSRNFPKQREWYAIWNIYLKENLNFAIGNLCYKGLSNDGTVEIGYGIEPAYQGEGYATEAVSGSVQWAISQPSVKKIEAETEPGNIASQRVLEKSGFVPTGKIGEEGPRFVWNH